MYVCLNLCQENFIDPVLGIGKCVEDNGGQQALRTFYSIISPRFTLKGDKATFMPAPTDDWFSYEYINIPEGGVPSPQYLPFTVHPRYKWEWDFNSDSRLVFGNSTPCLTGATFWNDLYPTISHMDFYYMGRLGENRFCDNPLAWALVEKDGEEIFSGSMPELISWSFSNLTARPRGEYKFTIENDNVLVDGLQGLNTTVITVNASATDHEPPTLTMVTFRNSHNDNIEDHFQAPEDGILEFSAVDFSTDVNSYGYPFLVGNPLESVKVEYSPLGENVYTELPVYEIPELYFMPEFGHFYRGSLETVTKGSANGWFKLRFTVTDAAGNSQVQTIEPAFRIESAITGIESVNPDDQLKIEDGTISAIGEISVYDTLGNLVKKGNASVSTLGLKGIYIVKTINSTTKIVL